MPTARVQTLAQGPPRRKGEFALQRLVRPALAAELPPWLELALARQPAAALPSLSDAATNR